MNGISADDSVMMSLSYVAADKCNNCDIVGDAKAIGKAQS